MLPDRYRWILEQFEPEGDPWQLFEIAQDLEKSGQAEGAAAVYDRAFGIDPTLTRIVEARARLLDTLAVVEHGLCFRYVPAGPFLIGSTAGDADERPVHPVWLDEFWMTETPVSWEDYCRLMSWQAPPEGRPVEEDEDDDGAFNVYERNKIILEYCEDRTTQALFSYYAHLPPEHYNSDYADPSRRPPRTEPETPMSWLAKPMVAVFWHEGVRLAGRLSSKRFGLPSEAQWEKAARGGLIGARYPWGDEPPTAERCDFGHDRDFCIRPSKSLPPNGYGLYSMSGGVSEWTRDWYDRDAYRASADHEPVGPDQGEEKVLRGGSWADCAEAVTVSFRGSWPPRQPHWQDNCCPMIGFRLCRKSSSMKRGRRAKR